MLAFVDNNVVSKYKVELTNIDLAKSLISEMLKEAKISTMETGGMIYVNDGNFDPERTEIIDGGIKHTVSSPERTYGTDYSRGTIHTTKIVYAAPYTLAIAAQNLIFGPYNYSQMLKLRHDEECLAHVTHGVDYNMISKLLAHFNNDVETLNFYLTTYHPDLWYLKRYLEVITLTKLDEYHVDLETEDSIIGKEQRVAATNTNVEEKLGLSFRGR